MIRQEQSAGTRSCHLPHVIDAQPHACVAHRPVLLLVHGQQAVIEGLLCLLVVVGQDLKLQLGHHHFRLVLPHSTCFHALLTAPHVLVLHLRAQGGGLALVAACSHLVGDILHQAGVAAVVVVIITMIARISVIGIGVGDTGHETARIGILSIPSRAARQRTHHWVGARDGGQVDVGMAVYFGVAGLQIAGAAVVLATAPHTQSHCLACTTIVNVIVIIRVGVVCVQCGWIWWSSAFSCCGVLQLQLQCLILLVHVGQLGHQFLISRQGLLKLIIIVARFAIFIVVAARSLDRLVRKPFVEGTVITLHFVLLLPVHCLLGHALVTGCVYAVCVGSLGDPAYCLILQPTHRMHFGTGVHALALVLGLLGFEIPLVADGHGGAGGQAAVQWWLTR